MFKQEGKTVSQDEVRRALRHFQEQGGLITQLPEQVVPPRNAVGGKFAVYEYISENSENASN